jgi:hypothetical protein
MDGSLAPFETLTDVKLSNAGFDQAVAAVGEQVYVTGGLSGALVPTKMVGGATIASDGTLGAFVNVGRGLAIARGTHTATLIKDVMYVIGGTNGRAVLTSVERAAINRDGTLGQFEDLSD